MISVGSSCDRREASSPAPSQKASSSEPSEKARTGVGADAAGEARFDSVLGLLCVLNVLAGKRPDTAPDDPAIQHWEGWVLGQTALPRLPSVGHGMNDA